MSGRYPIVFATAERRAELRAMPYAAYLATPEWAQARYCVLAEAHGRCQVCASDDRVEVHHRTYDRRGGEWRADLVALCAECHERHHGVAPAEIPTHVSMPTLLSPIETRLGALAAEILEARRTGNDAVADRLTVERDAIFRRAG